MDNLMNIIESILFVSGDGVQISDIAEKLEVDNKEVKQAGLNLKEKYEKSASGIQLLMFNNKMQLCTNPDYIESVTAVLNPIKEKALTKAVLEVCAIIAYKQPITRTEVENVRGVNSDYAVSMLMENNMIEVVGRKDAMGKPLLFGTTDGFLKKFGLSSLEELPDYEELLERIDVIHTDKNDSSLFNFNDTEVHVEDELFNKSKNEQSTNVDGTNNQDNDESVKLDDEQSDKLISDLEYSENILQDQVSDQDTQSQDEQDDFDDDDDDDDDFDDEDDDEEDY